MKHRRDASRGSERDGNGHASAGDHVDGDKVAGDKVLGDKVAGFKFAPQYTAETMVFIAGDNHARLLQDAAAHAQVSPIHQLPAIPSDFVGRKSETRKIHRWSAQNPSAVINIFGAPGTGKSVLAIQAARTLKPGWADTELYVDLRNDGQAASVEEILAGLLVILGLPASEIPQGVPLRAATLRSMLASHRTVMVIDNASSADQITPLLPGHGAWIVIVTSWVSISDLAGARQMPVHRLDDVAAQQLLVSIVRRPTSPADSQYLKVILDWCDGLPLAIRIAGGLLRSRTYWGWSDLAKHLRDAGKGRVGKNIQAQANHASLSIAYASLPEDSSKALRLLALTLKRVIPRELSYRVLKDLDHDDVLDDLLVRQLLEPVNGNAVRMHDLLSVFARHRSAEDDPAEVQEGVTEAVTEWSTDSLLVDYPRRLVQIHSHLPSALPLAQLLDMREHYVETPLRIRNELAPPRVVFPGLHRRLLVEAPGGSGKTSLVNYLCLKAGEDVLSDDTTYLPFLVLAREAPSATEPIDLLRLVQQSLKYRYDHDTTKLALEHVFATGRSMLIVDGLDEIPSPAARLNLIDAISVFSDKYSEAPVLVTTRPSAQSASALPQFIRAELSTWSSKSRHEYIQGLSSVGLPDNNASGIFEFLEDAGHDDSSFLQTPLGLQLALSSYALYNRYALDDLAIVEALIEGSVQREGVRGTGLGGEPELKMLEYIAFRMQSHSSIRTIISGPALDEMVIQYADHLARSDLSYEEGYGRRYQIDLAQQNPRGLTDLMLRSSIMAEVGMSDSGDAMFGFTHNLFREYLAAAYLARQQPEDLVREITARGRDRGWDSVARMALRIVKRKSGEEPARRLLHLLDSDFLAQVGTSSIDDLH